MEVVGRVVRAPPRHGIGATDRALRMVNCCTEANHLARPGNQLAARNLGKKTRSTGLLAKIYLVEELREGRGATMKVDFIITLNTPHRGADWRNPVILLALAFSTCLNAIPIVRRFHLLRQLADLSPWSSNIRFLEQYWNTCISVTPDVATAECRYIQSIAICGLRDWLVSRKSAAGFYSDRPDATFNAHPIDSPKLADYIGHLL